MRGLVVVGLSVLAFGAGIAQAEARFRVRFGGGQAAPVRTVASTPGLAVVPGLSLRLDDTRATAAEASDRAVGVLTADALAPGEVGSLKIPTSTPVVAPVPAAKKPSEPWCPSGKLAGSGSGFCLIN